MDDDITTLLRSIESTIETIQAGQFALKESVEDLKIGLIISKLNGVKYFK